MNLWVHDGSKDITVNRMEVPCIAERFFGPDFCTEVRSHEGLYRIKSIRYWSESYTVGSNDFYIGYGVQNQKLITLDTGHFHPTESVADKVSSLLLYVPELMLHVSRPVRWDSDHVTIMNDDTPRFVQGNRTLQCVEPCTHRFGLLDASINRIGAYVIGMRATQKCLLQALL